MEKIIWQTVTLNCTKEEAFKLFVDKKHLEKWLTRKAIVEPKAGGKYEMYWDLKDLDNDSTKGCKILAIDEPHYLNVEWNGPKQYKHFMQDINPMCNVNIMFNKVEGKTRVSLIHTGWRDTSEWEEARQYFDRAWRGAFVDLVKYVDG